MSGFCLSPENSLLPRRKFINCTLKLLTEKCIYFRIFVTSVLAWIGSLYSVGVKMPKTAAVFAI